MGGAAHNCRRAAYAAAPAGATGTDRLFLREAGCRRMRSRNPVEQPAPSLVAASRSTRQSCRLRDEGADGEQVEEAEEQDEERRERVDAAQREQAVGGQRQHEHEDGQLAPLQLAPAHTI